MTMTMTDYKGGEIRSYGETEVEVIADIPGWYVLAWVPIDAVNVDQSYQRTLSTDFAHRLKTDHDPRVEDPPLLGLRESGVLYVISGQHRLGGAQLRREQEGADERIICRIIQNVERAEEAELRLKGNVALPESSVQKFKAKVAARQPEALAIVALCEQFGTHVNTAPNVSSGINTVAAMEKLYRVDDGHLLARTFEVIRDAWGEVGGVNASSALLSGIAWFLAQHHSDFDRVRLIEKMQKNGPDLIKRKAVNHRAVLGGALWVNVYRTLVEIYNELLNESNRLEAVTGGWSKSGFSMDYSGAAQP